MTVRPEGSVRLLAHGPAADKSARSLAAPLYHQDWAGSFTARQQQVLTALFSAEHPMLLQGAHGLLCVRCREGQAQQHWRPSWQRSGGGGQTPGTPLLPGLWQTATR